MKNRVYLPMLLILWLGNLVAEISGSSQGTTSNQHASARSAASLACRWSSFRGGEGEDAPTTPLSGCDPFGSSSTAPLHFVPEKGEGASQEVCDGERRKLDHEMDQAETSSAGQAVPLVASAHSSPSQLGNFYSMASRRTIGASSAWGVTRKDEKSILGRAVLTTPHRRMPAVRIAPGPRPPFLSPQTPGPIMMAEPIFVTKFSLSESLGCTLRDLRVIDQFAPGGRYSAAFLARKNGVIVTVGHIRAIVMRDQVLIFLPEVISGGGDGGGTARADMGIIEHLIDALVTYLNSIYHISPPSGGFEDYDHGTTGGSPSGTASGHQWGGWYTPPSEGLMPGNGLERKGKKRAKRRQRNKSKHGPQPSSELHSGAPPPFELVVIEALLGHVCSHDSARAAEIIETASDILEGITPHVFSSGGANGDADGKEKGSGRTRKRDGFMEMQAKLGDLLPLKNKVDELEATCAEVASAIADVLKSDEDMAAMRLSSGVEGGVASNDVDPENLHVEVELLFEDYLLQMDEVLYSLRAVQSSVRNTEEVLEIELDLLRNLIMKNEMLLELSGLVVGCGAAITGLFGMNLVSHAEEHPIMFYNVSAFIVVLMATMGFAILKKLQVDNLI